MQAFKFKERSAKYMPPILLRSRTTGEISTLKNGRSDKRMTFKTWINNILPCADHTYETQHNLIVNYAIGVRTKCQKSRNGLVCKR